jgi:hypothetical protein
MTIETVRDKDLLEKDGSGIVVERRKTAEHDIKGNAHRPHVNLQFRTKQASDAAPGTRDIRHSVGTKRVTQLPLPRAARAGSRSTIYASTRANRAGHEGVPSERHGGGRGADRQAAGCLPHDGSIQPRLSLQRHYITSGPYPFVIGRYGSNTSGAT